MNENVNHPASLRDGNFEVKAQSSNTNKITALYVRVSTLDQHTGLESQIRTLKEFCDKNIIKNYEIFADEGISGAKNSRPSLDRMMTMVREKKVDSVVVYSFSRFARSVTHLLTALEEFNKLGVSFVSYTEKMDTNSPMGKMVFVIISAVSQLERDLIIERVKNGLKNAKAKGIHIGRKKTRPSELIRALLEKGLPQRTISSVASCSNGSVSLEKREWKREKAALLKQQQEQNKEVILSTGDLNFEAKKPDEVKVNLPIMNLQT